METMGERIKRLRLSKKLTQEELGSYFGLKRAAINKYEKGNVENMKRSIIEEMSKFFNVSPSYLMALDNSDKDNVEELPIPVTSTYNYFDTGLSAGILTQVDPFTAANVEQISLSDVVMGKYAGDQDIFISHINGESMNRVIPDKSLIAVKRYSDIRDLKNGDIVVFRDGGDMSVKRFYNDIKSQIITFTPDSTESEFHPINYRYEDIDELEIVGRVVVYTVEL